VCGVVAFYNYRDGARIDRELLIRARDHMLHRGPDGCGIWIGEKERVALAHRRLSIIELSEAGAQPMRSHDGELVISFNGEIYNYRALRKELEREGFQFRTQSDTEVLLHLYAAKGQAMVHELRGMYAFALWDATKQALFLVRDPYGIKPLYYADNGRQFRVASQVKTLLTVREDIDTLPEPAGHVGFFLWGSVPEPFTLYKGIRALPAGCWLWVGKNGAREVLQFANITKTLVKAELRSSREITPRKQGERLREALLDTVRHHLLADVEVGLFLSAGLDSVTLLALATELKGSVHTVTLGFDEYRGTAEDEVPLAEHAAAQYGARHQTVRVTQADLEKESQRLFAAMDQPTIDGINSYFVSRAAAQAGLKVAISGLGGDELFGGYPSFRQIPRLVRNFLRVPLPHWLGRSFRVITAPVLKRLTSPKYAGLFEYGGSYGGAYLLRRGLYMPWELPQLLDPDMVREGWRALQACILLEATVEEIRSDRLRITALESTWYMRNQLLRDTDWASMAHSLETRLPLVDYQLLRTVAPLIDGKRQVTKQSMATTPRVPLPSEILQKPKTGFTVPVRDWLVKGQPKFAERGLRGWALYVSRAGRASVL